MKIWIDGDACPNAIKRILFRAAIRTETQLILVANQFIDIPPSPFIERWIVGSGFDVADNKIIDNVEKNDLVITADIPLANSIIDKQGVALNPRGQLYSSDNIKQILSQRNFNEILRDSGLLTGGPGPLSKKEIQCFSNHLSRILKRYSSSS